MKRRYPALLLAALALATLPGAEAGPLRDAIRAARARGEAAPAERDGVAGEGLDDGDRQPARIELPPGAREQKDVAYGSDPAQRLDVYLPREAHGAPVILMIHGGGWIIGDKGNAGVVAAKVAHWLPRGYIVVSANYRMARPPAPLEQADDVARALAYVQANARTWGGDPSRLVLMGHSSGAHLVALLAADPGIATRQAAQPWLGSVLLDSAALDLVGLMQARHARIYDRVFGADPAAWAEASPLQRLVAPRAPVLLVCSTRRSDSCPAARAFAAKATSLGARADILPVDLGHGEVNASLGRASAYTAAVDDFMRRLGLP